MTIHISIIHVRYAHIVDSMGHLETSGRLGAVVCHQVHSPLRLLQCASVEYFLLLTLQLIHVLHVACTSPH